MGYSLKGGAGMEWSRRVKPVMDVYGKRRVLSFGHVKAIWIFAVSVAGLVLLPYLMLHSGQPASIYRYTAGRTKPWRNWNETAFGGHPDENLYLYYLIGEYGLTQEIPWAARRIKTVDGAATRLSITDVRAKFMTTDFTYVRIVEDDLKLRVQKPVKLQVHHSARPGEVDASALLVGMSTTYSRLLHSDFAMVRDWQRWLTDGWGQSNGATLMLTLHRASPSEASFVESQLKRVGIDAMVVAIERELGPVARHLDLVGRIMANGQELLRAHRRQKRYLVLADDDMFFPNLAVLLQRLSTYDPEQEHYLGLPSERPDWTKDNRTMETYGGGAVVLTLPLARRVAGIDCTWPQSSPADDLAASKWDYALYQCITSHTKLDLHLLPSLYNPQGIDLVGPEGAALNEGYGGGLQPLTLHQYRAFHRFEAGRGHEIASICGEDCFLQRFRFQDNWILVAGYTISHYPDGVTTMPLAQSSRFVSQLYASDVWRAALGSRLVVDAPPMPSDTKVLHWTGPKRTWRLLDSQTRENGEIWQAYLKSRSGENSFSDVDDRLEWGEGEEFAPADSLILLIWEP
jgi:hypothetical protein